MDVYGEGGEVEEAGEGGGERGEGGVGGEEWVEHGGRWRGGSGHGDEKTQRRSSGAYGRIYFVGCGEVGRDV